MSANLEQPPDEALHALSGGFASSESIEHILTLGDLPLGARLVLRCRKDWRDATIILISSEKITLAVGSPSGHTYRVRRVPDSPLYLDGSIPVLCEGAATPPAWRAGRVGYEARW